MLTLSQDKSYFFKLHRKQATTVVNFSLVQLYSFALLTMSIMPGIAWSHDNEYNVNYCSKTAGIALKACKHDTEDDYLVTTATCLNLEDSEERATCMEEATEEKQENYRLCKQQLEARNDVCEDLGQERYDVTQYWTSDNFVNPLQIGVGITANPYFSLIPGSKVFVGGDETITVTVTDRTKLINGVTCLVVNDIVQEDGKDVEDTDDWYAQDINGNVWYCGEVSKNYEFFAGDNPEVSELVDLEGSWKAFRDGAMPGIHMKSNPQPGDVYRQEMLLQEAEDVAKVITTSASGMLEDDICEEDGEAIAAFIDSVCNNDCLVTQEYTPLEPGVMEHKYYAPGRGFILETDPEGSCVIPDGAI